MKKIGLISVALIIFFLCILGYAYFIEPNRLVVTSHDVEIEKPIKDCKVVFFTDTHFGELYKEENVEKVVDKINALEADVVIFGGDLFDNYARDYEILDLAYLQDAFKRIEAKAGKYAVWGNHDYGGGASRIYEEFMIAGEFELLSGEHHLLEEYGIDVFGYDDYLMKGAQTTIPQTQSDLFHLFISHEPIIARTIKTNGESFMFSGHTHGGQVQIPFLTEDLLPVGSDGFRSGLYDAEEIGTESPFQLFVSSGIGVTRYPFRFLNAPEIIEINFKEKQ